MSRFNELISGGLPVIVCFCNTKDIVEQEVYFELQELANKLKGRAVVKKIDIDLNPQLAMALRIKTVPTLLLYKNNVMIWRQSNTIDSHYLAKVLLPLL